MDIEIAEPLSSKTLRRGDTFGIRLAQPIVSDAGVLVPAGVKGIGQVVSAAPAGMLGKPGELLLAARYLEYKGARIPLRSFKLGASGKDNSGPILVIILAAGTVGMLAFMIPGGEIQIPSGTAANAKLAADVILPVLPPAQTESLGAAPSPAGTVPAATAATPTTASPLTP